MALEWDERKRQANLVKHGVDFVDVTALFDGETIETRFDHRKDYGETRLNCVGAIEGRVYVVTYVWRAAARRIISARKANARERRAYYARVA
jgi:uncharacterized DUF497 family protein